MEATQTRVKRKSTLGTLEGERRGVRVRLEESEVAGINNPEFPYARIIVAA
jgi:hypothetical protein